MSRKEEYYRCQYCGGQFPAKQWKENDDQCPDCGRKYNAIQVQDDKE
jgi:rubrerythrin